MIVTQAMIRFREKTFLLEAAQKDAGITKQVPSTEINCQDDKEFGQCDGKLG